MRQRLSNRNKVILHDLWAILAAWILAFAARFNFEIPPDPFADGALFGLPLVILVQAAVSRYFGLYRGVWRFASLPDLWNIIRSAVLGVLLIAIALFAINRLAGVPRSVLVLYPLFLIFLLGGPRLLFRMWKDHALRIPDASNSPRVVIVGAGSGGELVVRDMLRKGSHQPVAMVDDDARLRKSRIHDVPVSGTIEQLPRVVENEDADSIIIAVPTATAAQMQRIVKICEATNVPFRTLPRIYDGQIAVESLREVAIDDLLGREKIELNWQQISGAVAGKSVLVSGGGGSIGSELCRQVATLGPARLTVFERAEHNLYEIERELRASFPLVEIDCVLGDVCDPVSVAHSYAAVRPDVVFHAAAYKHVHILQSQVREALKNNVLGTENMAQAALVAGCETFVLISTDKAVRPSSVMGATKRLAELVCEARVGAAATRFITVRFGNVLGSAGSVVPLFKEQIKNGGPVTVTHPEASRYFMTIPEASQLILQAAAVGEGGEIFVLDMGEPVNIRFLAEQMIRLSAGESEQIEIIYTGLRPGEKLTEALFNEEENLAETGHEKLLLAQQVGVDTARVRQWVTELQLACDTFDDEKAEQLLSQAVPDLAGTHLSPDQQHNVVEFRRS